MAITLTTDLGTVYAAEMKGKILSINPTANIVDITHTVSPQNTTEGAFVLRSVVHHFPGDTIHICVVDPRVGTERKGLIVVCEGGVLLGPDNGVLMPAAERLGLKSVYGITNQKYLAEKISSTFHGRDVFAPVAAHLSKGVRPEAIGKKTDKYKHLEKGEITTNKDRISGEIMYIDQFGNIITNIGSDLLKKFKWNDKVNVRLGGRTLTLKFLPSYGHAKKNELLLTISSFDLLEIACNMDNASNKLLPIMGGKVAIWK